MSKPFGFRGKEALICKFRLNQWGVVAKESNLLVFAIALLIFAFLIGLWNSQTTAYAHAYTGPGSKSDTLLPLLESKDDLFQSKTNNIVGEEQEKKQAPEFQGKNSVEMQVVKTVISANPMTNFFENDKNYLVNQKNENVDKLGIIAAAKSQKSLQEKRETKLFAEKLYGIVGESPIKEMVPFISKRDEKVAAFLIGIAKKESSFGFASPSKDGQTCFNYWGYKGSGGRGTGMGYACFASAEEAIDVVGNRLEILVNNQRNTPARMVDTWKCGTTCAGDPGAPGWTSTVALYFNQIVRNEG